MRERMKNCWEIKACDREKGGAKVSKLGECIASKESLGHSCWAIAGTLCGGKVRGTAAQKEQTCMICDVFELYNRMTGSEGERIVQEFPEVGSFRTIHEGTAIPIKRKWCNHKGVQEQFPSPMVHVHVDFRQTQEATETC